MAWTEQCKIDANRQVEHLKETKGYSTRKACQELSGESGIPVKTLQEWATYPDGRPERKVSEKSDTLKLPPAPQWMAEVWENFKENGKWPNKKMELLHTFMTTDEGLEFLNKETSRSIMRVRLYHLMLCCYYKAEERGCSETCPLINKKGKSFHQKLKEQWGWPPKEEDLADKVFPSD